MAINVIISLLEKVAKIAWQKLSAQARALPYKALLGHYYVMDVSLRLRITLTGLQRVVFVEILTADLRQTKI